MTSSLQDVRTMSISSQQCGLQRATTNKLLRNAGLVINTAQHKLLTALVSVWTLVG